MQKNGVPYGKNNNASSKKTLLSAYFGTVEAIMLHGIIFYEINFIKSEKFCPPKLGPEGCLGMERVV